MRMRTRHVCGQCVCAHITRVVNAYAHTPHVWSMRMRTHHVCGQCVCAHITCAVNAYAHAPHVWSMRMRTHHVVTIYSRKPIIVIAIVLVLSRFNTIAQPYYVYMYVYVCVCIYYMYCIVGEWMV